MRSVLFLGAFVGLAATSSVIRRQGIDFDGVDAAGAENPVELTTAPVDPSADPGSYDSAAASAAAANDPITTDSSKEKRDSNDCTSEPAGYAPNTSTDSDQAFLADSQYPSIAGASATPQGYSLAFSGLNAATQSGSYITYKVLKSYDTIQCQQYCDAANACYFFNVYMERDPSIKPGDGCLNPASTVNYKCALFGAQQTSKTAVNAGGWRRNFHVVIAGSNGYNKLAAPSDQPGFNSPVELGGAINAPDNSYMGMKYFPGPYDPAQCLSACQATTDYDQKTSHGGAYDTCYFVNTYVLSKNNDPQGTYCSMYTKAWAKKYAVNWGQYRGSDYYSVSQSYGWTLSS